MLTYAIVLIVVMICTYNPTIKSRVSAAVDRIKPKKAKENKKNRRSSASAAKSDNKNKKTGKGAE
jgi:hypothetical protein